MGVGWLAATEEARLLGNVAKICLAAITAGAGTRQRAFVGGHRLISTGIARAF